MQRRKSDNFYRLERKFVGSVVELLNQSGQNAPPVLLEKVLPLRKISRSIKYSNSLSGLARLVPISGGFEVSTKEYRPFLRHQWRFSIAHEIGHTLFYSFDKPTPERKVNTGVSFEDEERLCDRFASELLMPGDWVTQEFSKRCSDSSHKKRMEAYVDLCKLFDVSLQSMAIKLIPELTLWKCILFCCAWVRKNPDECASDKNKYAWRVLWYVLPDEFAEDIFIPNIMRKQRLFPKFKYQSFDGYSKNSTDAAILTSMLSKNLKIGNLEKNLKHIYGEIQAYPVVLKRHDASTYDTDTRQLMEENSDSQIKPMYLIAIPLECKSFE